ncbi:baculoviral IAP repeat-containing protein 5 [Musca domestica]|uniref:Baculoviral IAP repeat-containing protein 5 n=1 Tax=Musca domestica TaxID=7370 RepID=A0A1I8MA93_MUSDO|nr:baculoviral IAP repeat-containing protein 5 [Musca domestica]
MSEMRSEKFKKFNKVYLLEKQRIDSFKNWPYDEAADCSISKMAQAGFYWSGNKSDDDTVTCFVCGKTLHGWDPTDDPWKEHAKHAPQCQFVKYGHKEADLTVEEFLNIFSAVGMNKMMKDFNGIKSKFLAQASSEMEKCLMEKK